MSVNEFIKDLTKLFGKVSYKATNKDGLVFKTKDWDEVNIKFDK